MAKKSSDSIQFPEPAIARLFFADTKMTWLWLIVRLYVGYQWVMAGWEKMTDPMWTGSKAGVALTGFLKSAMMKAGGEHPSVQGWYAAFLKDLVLPNVVLFSHMVAWGEVLVGVAIILGLFTGIAAFFGAFMNMNYLLAGTVSTNPILFVGELFLVLAWRVAGWIGLDRVILPMLGTPWKPGKLFGRK